MKCMQTKPCSFSDYWLRRYIFTFRKATMYSSCQDRPGKSSGQETWCSIDPSLCHCPTNNTWHKYSTWVFLLGLIMPMLGNQPRFNYSALDPKHHPSRKLRTRTIVTMYSIYLRISFVPKKHCVVSCHMLVSCKPVSLPLDFQLGE